MSLIALITAAGQQCSGFPKNIIPFSIIFWCRCYKS